MPYTYAGEFADAVFNTSGRPLKSAAITVKTAGGALATLYTDRTKTATVANPVSTDSYGNLRFFADPGPYQLEAAAGPLGGVLALVAVDPAEAVAGGGGGGAPTGAAGGSLAGTYPNPSIAAGAVSATEVAAANKDGVAGTPSMRTLGSGAQQAAAGNDARLSDQRTPVDGSVTTAKIADGAVTAAKVAADVATQAELDAEAAARAAADLLLVPLTQKGAASGVATLDSGGKVPSAQLPAIAISDFLGTVVSQAAMLALSGQRGDWAIRSDTSTSWVLIGDDATQLANWKQLATPPDAVLSVQGLTGVVVLPADDVSSVASLRTLGTGAQQATPGTHPASSDHPNLGNGTPTSSTPGDSGTAGVGGTTARADHRHGRADSYAAANPQALGAAAPGTAATVSRGDHVHPTTGMALSTDVTAEAAARVAGDTTRQANTQTANYTLVLADAGLVVEVNAATGKTVTIPTDASVAFPTGSIVWVQQIGAGAATVAGAGGVTVEGATVVTSGVGSGLLLRKRAANDWVVQATSSATSGSGLPATIQSKATTYTAAAGEFVKADATSGGFTVTLPSAPATGALVAIKKMDASANVVTVAPAGSGSIDGSSTATIVSRYAGAVLEHLGSDVWAVASVMSSAGPTGPTGPAGPMGTNGVQSIMADGVLARWYPGDGAGFAVNGLSNQSIASGTMSVGVPRIAQENITIDQLGCYVQTLGAAGAVVRLGVYQPTASNPFDLTLGAAWATLLADGGTVAADAGGLGAKTVTLGTPLAIAAGTPFVVVAAVQGGAGAVGIYHEGLSDSWQSPFGSASILAGASGNVRVTGVTAAFPATLTPGTFQSGVGGCGWYRRSA